MLRRPRAPRVLLLSVVLVAVTLGAVHPATAGAQPEPGIGGSAGSPAAADPAAEAEAALLAARTRLVELVTRHGVLVERLDRLRAEGHVAAGAVLGSVRRLLPVAGGEDPAALDAAAAVLVDNEVRATYEELLEVRSALTEANPGPAAGIGIAVFPVGGTYEYVNSWGQARSGGRRHKGTDILAPEGTELYAIESGRIERYSNNRLGGLSFYFQGDSGARYYYAHLAAFGPQAEGEWVEVGTVIGYVGDTGNARGTPHLHFQYAPDGGERWVNPYPLLQAIEGAVWPGVPLPASLLPPGLPPATD